MPTKILVVDDDKELLASVKKYLLSNSYSVISADNGTDALLLAQDSKPDILLIDADLPGLDGHSVCAAIKKRAGPRAMPVIIVSGSKVEDKDVVGGLGLGADDYVFKPFSLPVLLARVKAVLRRYATPDEMKEMLKSQGIELDAAARTVKVGAKPVALTRKEFDLLAMLLTKPGRALSVPYLLETVWGYDPAAYNDAATVEVHISRLRKKLGAKIAKRIVSVMGHGYKFEE